MNSSTNYLGKPCERVEDSALLTGGGRYLDDLPLPIGTLYAAVVRSPIAHGKIISVELDISNNKAVILIYNFLMLLFCNRQKIS